MGIYVNTNVSALKGQTYLNKVNNSLNTTYERLSSGLRINSAKDDAAGLQIANRLTSQINGLNQANRNANDAIALAQTIEAGLDEISNMFHRIRTLAVQSANGINTQEDRAAISAEAAQLTDEISRIAEYTTYGGKSILCGSSKGTDNKSIYKDGDVASGTIDFQVGANSGDTITLKVYNFMLSELADNVTAQATKGAGDPVNGYESKYDRFILSTAENASKAITDIDAILKKLIPKELVWGRYRID